MGILIIDTNKDYESLYRRKLTPLFEELDIVNTLTKAWSNLQRKDYDLIILSHVIKRSSGKKVYDKIRKMGYNGEVIIAITGNGVAKIYEEYDNSVVAIINKATNGEDLRSVLSDVLESVRGKCRKTRKKVMYNNVSSGT